MLGPILAALAMVADAPPARPPELTPEQWRDSARRDVEAIHDILRDNAPFMVVDRGVKLAGVETGADTIFMDGMTAPLPSGKATISFGIKAWVQRRRGSNQPYEPDPQLRYTGNLSDEPALKSWLAARLGVKLP